MIFFKLFLIIISVFALHRSGIYKVFDGLVRRIVTKGVFSHGQGNFNYNLMSWAVCLLYLIIAGSLTVATAAFSIVVTTLVPPIYNAINKIINKIKI